VAALTLPLENGADVRVTGVRPDVAAAIRETYLRTRGANLAAEVLNDARDPGSPLHKRFTWTDSIAAEKWRLSEAEALIRRVKVQVIPAKEAEPIIVRAYVSDQAVSGTPITRRYVGIEDVENHAAALLIACQRDIAWLRKKYGHLEAFSDLLRAAADDIESGAA
jgi:hypothetical protein